MKKDKMYDRLIKYLSSKNKNPLIIEDGCLNNILSKVEYTEDGLILRTNENKIFAYLKNEHIEDGSVKIKYDKKYNVVSLIFFR